MNDLQLPDEEFKKLREKISEIEIQVRKFDSKVIRVAGLSMVSGIKMFYNIIYKAFLKKVREEGGNEN